MTLLRKLMRGRRKQVHRAIDGLSAHKNARVRDYLASTKGRLTLHFLPGYAPDLKPDELVCTHDNLTGGARQPLRAGESLCERIEEQLNQLKRMPALVRSFFRHPSVAYIADC